MDNFESIVGLIFVLFAVGLALAFLVLNVVIYYRIVSKTGYNGWLGLLMFVPVANFVLLLVLAFGEWPIYRELADARNRVSAT